MAAVQVSLPLPVLPEGWAGEKDFKAIGHLSQATPRNVEPVGPHFLAHARRVRFLPVAGLAFRMLTFICRSVISAHFPRMTASRPNRP